MQIGDDFYEDLTPETTLKIVDALAKGEKPKPGPQSGRMTSENAAGLTTLTSTVSASHCGNSDFHADRGAVEICEQWLARDASSKRSEWIDGLVLVAVQSMGS